MVENQKTELSNKTKIYRKVSKNKLDKKDTTQIQKVKYDNIKQNTTDC